MRRCVLALLFFGCGEVHFVDPNPPRLFRASPQFTLTTKDEPLVWMTILDLFVEHPSACDDARESTLAMVRSVFADVPGEHLELPSQDLSPSCGERGEALLDVDAAKVAFAAAQNAFPGTHVRPVLVYVDDINLPAPPQVLDGLRKLHGTPVAGTSKGPLLWAVAFPVTVAAVTPDRFLSWTYTGDPALAKALATRAGLDLPLRTVLPPTPVPLLDAGQLGQTLELKLCRDPPTYPLAYGPPTGMAQVVDPAHAPRVLFSVPNAFAVPKGSIDTTPIALDVEGCTGNCDRYYIGSPGDIPARWDETNSCLLGAP